MRYEKVDNSLLEPEIESLTILKQIIDEYVFGKSPTVKLVMFKDFSSELEMILNKFKPQTSVMQNNDAINQTAVEENNIQYENFNHKNNEQQETNIVQEDNNNQ